MKKTILLFSALYLALSNAFALRVTIQNNSAIPRKNETVEINWNTIQQKLKLKPDETVVVTDASGREIPSQQLFEGKSSCQKLIFQVSVAPSSTIGFNINKGKPQSYPVKTFGRHVPERKDDYAWENDRVAFRIYGPALIKTDGPSNGIDVWCKRTEELIIDRRYAKELSGKGSYHTDWGDGLDFYKVGRTLGAGAMAPYSTDSLWLAQNWLTQETLDKGPVRTTFRLTYAPFNVNGQMISETRTISLDAGSQLNRIIEEYTPCQLPMNVAAGIVTRTGKDSVVADASKGYAIYIEPANTKDGQLCLAIVYAQPWKKVEQKHNHLLAVAEYKPNQKLTYYAGNGWSKWGFPSPPDWVEYIKTFSAQIRKPLKISIR